MLRVAEPEGKNSLMATGMLSFSSYSDPHSAEVVERFYETNFLSKPINVSIKYNITRGLLFLDKNDHVSPLGRVFWSVIPAIILVGVALITSAVRRQWAWVLIFSLIMVRAAILFLTAPAHYFMYYLPVFISGLFIGLLWVSHHDFGARKAKRGA